MTTGPRTIRTAYRAYRAYRGYKAHALRLLPYAFVAALYLLLSLEVRTRTESPDWAIFMQALARTIHGDPFSIYSLRVYDIHTFAYGPVPLFVMAPLKLLSEAIGAPAELDRWLTWLPVYFADVLAALLLCRVVRRSPLASPNMLLFLFTLYLSSWLVIFASPVDSHFESLVLVFLLLGIVSTGRGRYVLGGVLCGLALLTKQSAVAVVLPHLFVLWRASGTGAAARFAVSLGATGVLIMLPYAIVDPANTWYMAVTLPGLLPVAYQSILPVWKALPGVYEFLVTYSNAVILVLILIACLLAAQRGGLKQGNPRAYALYAACVLLMLDFEKWGYLHYFVLPFAMLAAWELLRGRWPWAAVVLGGFSTAMYTLNADVGTRLSFSYMIAPLALLLYGLTAYALYGALRSRDTG